MIYLIPRPDDELLFNRCALAVIEEAEHLHEFVNSASPTSVGADTIRAASDRLHALYEIWHGEILPAFGPY